MSMLYSAQQVLKLRRWSTWGVMIYMVMALGWWTILLFKKNKEIADLQTSLYQQNGVKRGSLSWEQLQLHQSRQRAMILGESVVFIGMLVIGLYWINRAFHRELDLATQKQNFLLSISHEFKSPLTAVKLGLETLAKRELDAPKKQQVISQALLENARLEKLISSLLLATKIESNYLAEPAILDLQAILTETSREVQSKNPESSINLQISSEAQLSSKIYMDLTSLRIILDNLLDNAIKYSKAPAKISLNTIEGPQHILLRVADEGIGIPDPEKNKVREKFYRSGSEETRKTQGTGLGLYLVDKLCALNHCQLTILDNKPQGTIIEVRIPKYVIHD